MNLSKRFLVALTALILIVAPAQAWTVTHKGAAATNSNANTVISAQTYAAGSIVALFGVSRGSTSSDVLTITGSVTGAIPGGQVYICGTGSANKSFIAWVYATGGSETWTLNNSAGAVTGMAMASAQIDGASGVSAEDAAARNCLTGQGVSPTINTTGTLAETGELVLGLTARIGSSLGYAEDATFTQIGTEDGSTNVRYGKGYREAPSTAAITYHPTTTQSNNNIQVIALKSSGAPAPCRVREAVVGGGVYHCR